MSTSSVRRSRSERGAVAGLDGLMVGVLVLLGGTVVVMNLWSVVATRSALDDAVREYLRAWTSASSPDEARTESLRALDASLEGSGVVPEELEVLEADAARFGPCASAAVTVRAVVPAVRAPFMGILEELEVRVSAEELVPPNREVISGALHDMSATVCGG